MNIREKAEQLHKSGFNCAQSVLGASSEYFGLDSNTALAVSAGFGGGVRSGEICGAISGAVMVLGMARQKNLTEPETKAETAAQTKALVETFREKYGCVRCHELKEAGVSCDELVDYAAWLAEEIIKNK